VLRLNSKWMRCLFAAAIALTMFGGVADLAFAEEAYYEDEAVLDSGDTAWMLMASVLVLFMTLPGLALFYGGLVRSKNVLSVLMQCFGLAAIASVLWAVVGYSLAFDAPAAQDSEAINIYTFVGGLSKMFLMGVTPDSLADTFPETVFIMFQMTFFIITPALIAGAYAERMKYSAMVLFSIPWLLLVYAPICHMAWSGDGALFERWGVLDFAGGTVVHINAGIAALVACIVLGPRKGYPDTPMPPHNLTMTLTGAAMLWVGWFGFNAGSELAANGTAGMAMLVTQLSTAAAVLAWCGIEWLKHGKPSALGAATGAIAGLVAITPAAGSVGPMGGLAIGFASGVICFVCATSMKRALGYDDSLDAFGVHGIGGAVGAILTGVFGAAALGGFEDIEIVPQVIAQAKSIVVTVAWCGVVSFILLKLIDLTIGLRVSEEVEEIGLDQTEHGEQGYIL